MAFVLSDRVKETTTTTGTGTITLAGTSTSFQTFGAALSDSDTTYYCIVDLAAGDWEVGVGTYTVSGTTLSRDTILESSNADAAVDFAAGTKDVFVTYPADKSVFLNAAGKLIFNNAGLTTKDQFYAGDDGVTIPALYFDATDFLDYSRTTNEFSFTIGGAQEWLFSGTLLQCFANNITTSGTISTGILTASGNVDFTNLPTSDPVVSGRLWNDSGTVKVSSG